MMNNSLNRMGTQAQSENASGQGTSRPAAEAQQQPRAGVSPAAQQQPRTDASQTTAQRQTDPEEAVLRSRQGPPPVFDRYYIPGFLSSNIGKNIRAEFVIGQNQYMDKTGRLVEVGVNFFVLEEFITNNRVMCDLYSVKFVTIF